MPAKQIFILGERLTEDFRFKTTKKLKAEFDKELSENESANHLFNQILYERYFKDNKKRKSVSGY